MSTISQPMVNFAGWDGAAPRLLRADKGPGNDADRGYSVVRILFWSGARRGQFPFLDAAERVAGNRIGLGRYGRDERGDGARPRRDACVGRRCVRW